MLAIHGGMVPLSVISTVLLFEYLVRMLSMSFAILVGGTKINTVMRGCILSGKSLVVHQYLNSQRLPGFEFSKVMNCYLSYMNPQKYVQGPRWGVSGSIAKHWTW